MVRCRKELCRKRQKKYRVETDGVNAENWRTGGQAKYVFLPNPQKHYGETYLNIK